MINPIIKYKPYPYGYTPDIIKIIDCITLSQGDKNKFIIQGSSGLSSQIYYGDYDILEKVDENIFKNVKSYDDYINKIVKRFQDIIKELLSMKLVYIGDFKCGEIPEWNVSNISQLKKLYSKKIINQDELETAINEFDCKSCFRTRRFGVIKWSPQDILNGYIILRDNSKYTLYDAIKSTSALTKLDIIAYIDNKFIEVSIIYNIIYKNKEISTAITKIFNSFYQSTELSYLDEKFFKVIKRLFSIARLHKDNNMLSKLNEILNSDLGRIYSVISDTDTIIFILENMKSIPHKRIEVEIQQFRKRLANIYTLDKWITLELPILKHINSIQFIKSRKELIESLTKLKIILNHILNYYSLQFLIDNDICVYGCNNDITVPKNEIINKKVHKNQIVKTKLELDLFMKKF
jgi:hypothetical protein